MATASRVISSSAAKDLVLGCLRTNIPYTKMGLEDLIYLFVLKKNLPLVVIVKLPQLQYLLLCVIQENNLYHQHIV